MHHECNAVLCERTVGCYANDAVEKAGPLLLGLVAHNSRLPLRSFGHAPPWLGIGMQALHCKAHTG